MEKIKDFHYRQQLPVTQLEEMQGYVRNSLDHVVNDGITDLMQYTGFLTSVTSVAEATAATGRVFKAGEVYAKNTETVLSLLPYLPQTTEKICAIAASVSEVDNEATPIKFLTDATTRQTQPESVSTEKHRLSTLNIIAGLESAAPQKPVVDAALLVICWIWLDNAGITKIEMNEAGVLPSVKKNAGRLVDLEAWKKEIGQRINTVSSDITALSQKTALSGENSVIYQIASDVANIKEVLELEDGYASYGANRFLTESESDTENVNFDCKIDEGVRFANVAEDLQALDVFNQFDANIKISDGFLLPQYSEVQRINIDEKTEELSVSQYPFETVELDEKTVSRTRIRYGDTRTVCSNSEWWRSGNYDQAARVFYKDGDAFQVVEGTHDLHSKWLRLRRFWYDTYEETYWSRIVNNQSVNGAMVGQTFLNSQDTWMTSLELLFTQVAATGDVRIVLTETAYGKPDVSHAIKSVTVAQADLVAGDWTKIPFPPTFLEKGKIYGLCLITQGNHYVAMTSGSNYAQGTFFYSTDGQFLQGDLSKDMCFRLNAAQFLATRLEVPLEALSLSGGIADIDLLAEMVVPYGSQLLFEVKPSGGVWYPLDEVKSGGTAFAGLPPLCEFRAVFIGNKDVMPGINLANSTYTISRPDTVAKHISVPIEFDVATQSVKVNLKIEEFYEANHDCTVTIDDVTNATTNIAPATTTDKVLGGGDDANHKNIIRTFEWTATELPVATDEIVITINMSTSSALDVFHGSEMVYLAF